MQIILDPTQYHRYTFDYDFSMEVVDFCRSLKEKWGWKEFGFFEKKWRFYNPEIIPAILNKYPQTVVTEEVKKDLVTKQLEHLVRQQHKEEALKIKQQATPTISIPKLKGKIADYQTVGVEFLAHTGGRAILADTMGLGKTVQALGYVLFEKEIKKTLVICPSSAKYVWEEETKKWTPLKPYIFSTDILKKSTVTDVISVLNDHDIFIINYDILKKFITFFSTIKFDLLVLDEFHYIKNTSAIRSKASKIIAKQIPRIILLSGTPILSRPIEMYNGLVLLNEAEWSNWPEFTRRYCNGRMTRFGWDVSGASHIEELQARIQHFFLRRTKEDVITELPPKRHIDIPVQLDSNTDILYKTAESQFKIYLKNIKSKTDTQIAKSLMAEKLVKLGELRQLATKGKLAAATDIIEDILSNDEKVVVFSCYNEVLKQIKEKFGNQCVLLIGESSDEERKEAIESFQNNATVKIFAGGIKSAGVGLTLTAAPNVLFIDYSWVPADHLQAEDRIHRYGQKADSVNIYQLYAKGTIDEYMREILKQKQEIFSKLVDGKSPEDINITKEVLNIYQQEI